MTPVRFAIVGTGWRAAFFLRVAAALPERFTVTGVLTRRDEARRAAAVRWGVPAVAGLAELRATRPDFVVACVSPPASVRVVGELAAERQAVLLETPAGTSVAEIGALLELETRGARIQVAEQYRFQPLHAARLAIAASGRLGTVQQAQVSVAHGYHGIAILRAFLGVGLEDARISAIDLRSTILGGPGRAGPPTDERDVAEAQVVAWLEYGDRFGVLDFSDEQYFSWIRSNRLLVRGGRGEIHDHDVRWLTAATEPHRASLVRVDTGHEGNLEGFHHVGYQLGEEWLYRNPFPLARLADDEIAVATCLARMGDWLDGGDGPCALAEATQDQYLTLLIKKAAASRRPVEARGLVRQAVEARAAAG